jgi:hypothetical protein
MFSWILLKDLSIGYAINRGCHDYRFSACYVRRLKKRWASTVLHIDTAMDKKLTSSRNLKTLRIKNNPRLQK